MFGLLYTARLLNHQTLRALAEEAGASSAQLAKLDGYLPKPEPSEWEAAKAEAVSAMLNRMYFTTPTNRLPGIDVFPPVACDIPVTDVCDIAARVLAIKPE